jgi:hypothetical protein
MSKPGINIDSINPASDSASGGNGKPADASHGEKTGMFWLNGDVLACACPGCGAPMSVRVWLMVADCWYCETSIELTPQQQREAEKLLEQRTAPALSAPSPLMEEGRGEGRPVVAPPKPAPTPVAKLVKLGPPVAPPVVEAAPPPVIKKGPPPLPDTAAVAPRRRPAWLLPLLAACAVIAIAALWWLAWRSGDPMNLAAKPPAPVDSSWHGKLTPAAKPAETKAAKAADELTAPRDAAGLPDLGKVISAIKTPSQPRMLEGRDPRVRSEVVEEEGGSVFTEAAVAAGLRWLSRHQAPNGSWNLGNFSHEGDCKGQCDGEGEEADTAGAALALLPFLGAGQCSKQGQYHEAISRGLDWLVHRQLPDGDLRGSGNGRMYAHGLATIVLCEATAMSGDDAYRPAAQRAIDFIVHAQHRRGGWRYHPGDEGDTSVVGWQLMALQSGKMAYLNVPPATFERAGKYLDGVKSGKHGGLFSYQPGNAPTPAMIAEGLLCREYLGWPQDHPGLREGVERLVREHLPDKNRPNIYAWYYATQVVHHVGGEPWKKWNAAVRDALLAMQEQEGHRAGSWAPRGGAIGDMDSRVGGRIYMTSLALCTLEVYYRYLPLYRAIDVSE